MKRLKRNKDPGLQSFRRLEQLKNDLFKMRIKESQHQAQAHTEQDHLHNIQRNQAQYLHQNQIDLMGNL